MSEITRREETERAFLALCIASPEEGAPALESLDVDEHFSSELLRRAARHLRAGDLRAPMSDPPGAGALLEDDPQLKGLLAELVVEAGRERSDPAMLEVQRLQLELARVERQIQRARGQDGGDVSALAQRKARGQARVRPGLRAGARGDRGQGRVRAPGHRSPGPSAEWSGGRSGGRPKGPRSPRGHRVRTEDTESNICSCNDGMHGSRFFGAVS